MSGRLDSGIVKLHSVCAMANSDISVSVQFNDTDNQDDQQTEEQKKYLTMKYGQSQIRLIQRRLKVEFWVDAELNRLYGIAVSILLAFL